MINRYLLIVFFCAYSLTNFAQTTDKSENELDKEQSDANLMDPLAPSRAAFYSAILPGLGQAVNKKYWKIPIVYGILAIPISTFIYNNDLYNKTKFGYTALQKQKNGDASDVDKIDPALKYLSIGSMQSYRNAFRRDRDYSILWFFIGWGINVVDATVFGHLKEFDVSDNLSMRIEPMIQPQLRQTGLSIHFNLKNTQTR